MTDSERAGGRETTAVARKMVDQAVQQFIEQGILDSPLLEAKPCWGAPPGIVMAMLREQGAPAHSFWLICGTDVPFDYVAASAAATPREAARHFAMRWHLQAARMQAVRHSTGTSDAVGDPEQGARLVSQAEAVFRFVNNDSFWPCD